MADTKMFTTDFLNELQAVYGLTSDYQLAKKLGLSPQAVGNYRAGRSFFSDDVALKVAHLLDLDPLTVLACANADRYSKQGSAEVFDFWANLADHALSGRVKMSQDAA